MPELLKAILDINPNVFNGQHANRWNNYNYSQKFNGLSPSGNYAQYSPQNSVQNSPSTAACIPQSVHPSNKPSNVLPPHPSPHVTVASPPSQSRFVHPATSTTPNHMTSHWNMADCSLDARHSQTAGRASVITEQKALQNQLSQNGSYYGGSMQNDQSFNQMSQAMNMGDMSQNKDPMSFSPSMDSQGSMNMQNNSFQQRGNLTYDDLFFMTDFFI
jgi:hypothetical protein